MFTYRFGRILLGEGAFKVAGTLLKLFAHGCLILFRLLQHLEIGLHLVPWNDHLAPKDACHPHLPIHASMAGNMNRPDLSLNELIVCCKARQNQAEAVRWHLRE
jgi:hypothetical protein